MVPPCQHIPMHSPCLQSTVIWICVPCRNIGITVHSKINEREIFHFFWIGRCTSQILLKEVLTFLPGSLHVRKYPLKSLPFALKMPGLLCRLDGIFQECLEMMRVKC